MATLLTLFPKSRKTLYDARSLLHSLPSSSSPSLLSDTLDELDRQTTILHSLLLNEPPQDRPIWSRKIDELREESKTLRSSLSTYTTQHYNPSQLHSQRSYLLSTGESLRNRSQKNYTEEKRAETRAVEEGVSLDQSLNMVDGMLRQGSESLRALSLQRNRLTGIRHLMVDIASTLNLSTSTIRIIERRDVQDKILVFGGMVVVCVVIWFLYFR
ncbi:hypothetical protein TrST_g9847 [Triparma strigata]|uniref:Golgi SNAP receptor complex member 2 n=1 Tax=Triparma strigata TaxID=1606541 RepID=A0A9W7BFZ8_9STRA|nr:hypothetical protein TrST_g9847 [Triparma strigata]